MLMLSISSWDISSSTVPWKMLCTAGEEKISSTMGHQCLEWRGSNPTESGSMRRAIDECMAYACHGGKESSSLLDRAAFQVLDRLRGRETLVN